MGLLFVLVVVVTAVGALSAGWNREPFRDWLVGKLETALDVSIELAALEGPLYPEFTLKELRVSDPRQGQLKLEHVRVRYSLADLMRRQLVVEDLQFANVELEIPKDATSGVESAEKDEVSEPSKFSLLIQHLEIDSLHFRFVGAESEDALAGNLDAELHDLFIGANQDAWPRFGTLALALEPLGSEDHQLRTARLDLDISPEGGTGVSVALDSNGGALKLDGQLAIAGWLRGEEPARLELKGAALAFDAQALTGLPLLASSLDGPFALQAELPANAGFEAATARLETQLLRSPGGTGRIELLSLMGSFEPRRWLLDSATLKGEGVELAAEGSGTFEGADELRVHGRLKELAGLQLLATDGNVLRGEAKLDAKIAGPWSDPTGQLELHAKGLSHGLVRLGEAHVSLSGDSAQKGLLRVNAASLSGPAVSLKVQTPASLSLSSLSEPLPEPLRITGSADLSALRFHPEVSGELTLDASLTSMTTGRLRVDAAALSHETRKLDRLSVELERTLADPQLVVLRNFEAATSGATLSADVPSRFRLENEFLHVEELRVRSDRGGLATLVGRLDPERFSELRFRLAGVNLDDFGIVSARGQPVSGELKLDLTLNGAVRHPRVTGSISLEAVQVPPATADQIRIELSTDNRILSADAVIVALGTEMARAKLRAPYPLILTAPQEALESQASEFDLRADALDLALLSPFLPSGLRDLRGRASGLIAARGQVDAPDVSGNLRVEDASVRVPLLRQTYAPIRVAIDLQPNALEIREFRAGPDGEHLSVSGSLPLSGLRPTHFDLALQLQNFALARLPEARVDTRGELVMRGPVEAPEILGTLELTNTRISPPEEDDDLLREVRILQLEASSDQISEGENPPLDSARADIQVKLPRNTWITGRGAELEISGLGELTKQPLEPWIFVGNFEVVRGTYHFNRRTLNVDRGNVTFTGAQDFDPLLDLLATARIRNYDVAVKLSGRLSNPQIFLSSSPSLGQTDIISLLLLGRTSADLESEQASSLESSVAQLGSEFLLGQLRESMPSWLPVDSFSVDADDAGGTKVQLGRYVGERVFIRYGRTTGPQATDEVRVEWRLTPTVTVEGGTASDGSSGADIIWRRDY